MFYENDKVNMPDSHVHITSIPYTKYRGPILKEPEKQIKTQNLNNE